MAAVKALSAKVASRLAIPENILPPLKPSSPYADAVLFQLDFGLTQWWLTQCGSRLNQLRARRAPSEPSVFSINVSTWDMESSGLIWQSLRIGQTVTPCAKY